MSYVERTSLEPRVDARIVALAGAAAVALGAAFFSTFRQMAETWAGSETYSHGFLVGPIALWLVWRERGRLARLPKHADARALVALLGMGLVWLLGRTAAVEVLCQLAAVGMIVAACWALAGPHVVRALAFPLGFLFLAVPMGEFLVPPLMAFTADFTVGMLRLSGLDVFQQNYYFMTTRGYFEVIKACSGARYFLAMLALSLVTAKVFFRAPRRRLALVAGAAVASVVLNGLRAYIVVMVAHFSHMRWGAGEEHIVFGWLLFAGLAVALVLVAARYSDRGAPDDGTAVPAGYPARASSDPPDAGRRRGPSAGFVAATLGAIVLGPAVWSIGALASDPPSAAGDLPMPAPAAGWSVAPVDTAWAPAYQGMAADLRAAYRNEGGGSVDLYIARYPVQRRGAEAVGADNQVFDWRDWVRVGERQRLVNLPGRPALGVDEVLIRSGARHRLVWRYYLVGDRATPSEIRVTAENLLALATGRSVGVSVILVSTMQDSADPDRDRQRLADFLADHFAALDHAAAGDGR